MQRAARMKRELEQLSRSPPHAISCFMKHDKIDQLDAQILGSSGTPYEKGIFKLEVLIPDRYPFEPPKVRFLTPIYHPNIDNAGRICLDTLKMPPKGAWKPSLNLSTVLTSIQLLMAEPNPEDPLMTEIANEFKYNRSIFTKKAVEHTRKHATPPDQRNDKNVSKQETLGKSTTHSAAKRVHDASSARPIQDVTNIKQHKAE